IPPAAKSLLRPSGPGDSANVAAGQRDRDSLTLPYRGRVDAPKGRRGGVLFSQAPSGRRVDPTRLAALATLPLQGPCTLTAACTKSPAAAQKWPQCLGR